MIYVVGTTTEVPTSNDTYALYYFIITSKYYVRLTLQIRPPEPRFPTHAEKRATATRWLFSSTIFTPSYSFVLDAKRIWPFPIGESRPEDDLYFCRRPVATDLIIPFDTWQLHLLTRGLRYGLEAFVVLSRNLHEHFPFTKELVLTLLIQRPTYYILTQEPELFPSLLLSTCSVLLRAQAMPI